MRFLLAQALLHSGSLDRLRELLAPPRIRTPRQLIALLALVVAPLSGLIPNTPIGGDPAAGDLKLVPASWHKPLAGSLAPVVRHNHQREPHPDRHLHQPAAWWAEQLGGATAKWPGDPGGQSLADHDPLLARRGGLDGLYALTLITNVVLAPGRYRFLDLLRYGQPLWLLDATSAPALVLVGVKLRCSGRERPAKYQVGQVANVALHYLQEESRKHAQREQGLLSDSQDFVWEALRRSLQSPRPHPSALPAPARAGGDSARACRPAGCR